MTSNWIFLTTALIFSAITFMETSSLSDHQEQENGTITEIESQLKQRLMMDYDNRMPSERPLRLEIGITPMKTVKVDVENDLLTMDLYMTYVWRDDRLVWDPEGSVDSFVLKAYELFFPEIELYYGTMKSLLFDPERALVKVTHTGTLSRLRYVRAEVYCDLSETPFFNQTCSMVFGTWAHDTRHMILSSLPNDGSEYCSFDSKTEEGCTCNQVTLQTTEIVYECCPNEIYPTATLHLSLDCGKYQRGGLDECALPVVLAPFLILLVFIIPRKATDRALVGSIVFLILLTIWGSGRITDEQAGLLRLSAVAIVAATFVAIVTCKIDPAASVSLTVSQCDDKGSHQSKARLATMLDLIMFVAVNVLLVVTTTITFK